MPTHKSCCWRAWTLFWDNLIKHKGLEKGSSWDKPAYDENDTFNQRLLQAILVETVVGRWLLHSEQMKLHKQELRCELRCPNSVWGLTRLFIVVSSGIVVGVIAFVVYDFWFVFSWLHSLLSVARILCVRILLWLQYLAASTLLIWLHFLMCWADTGWIPESIPGNLLGRG